MLALTACANNTILYNPPPQRISHDDLNYFKLDCDHASEQRRFLKTQLSYIPNSEQTRDRAMITTMLKQLQTNCLIEQEVTVNGCLHVREDMQNGSANATVCNDRRALAPREAPIVNHWDPLVDMK
jgi:hypothetical protein